MDIQAFINGLSAGFRAERSYTQMTLGKLISRLKELPPDMVMDGIASPHSYRGYYEDLAFEPDGEGITVTDALKLALDCLGETFTGYKGGDFLMDANAPVWLSVYGTSGTRIMEITNDGRIITEEEDQGEY